jgi:A/G-specific adenine glycosylase
VLSRWLALAHDPRTGAGKVRMERAAAEWIVDRDAAVINEATMELGALVCTPRNPQCGQCPLADTCRGYATGTPTQFPPPRVRTATVSVDVQALVVRSAQGVLLRRARPDELLTGFWILPQVGDHPALERGSQRGTVRHAITHHRIVWDVYDGFWTGGTLPEDWMWCPLSQLDRELVSSLPRKALRVAGIDLPTKKGAQTDSV